MLKIQSVNDLIRLDEFPSVCVHMTLYLYKRPVSQQVQCLLNTVQGVPDQSRGVPQNPGLLA